MKLEGSLDAFGLGDVITLLATTGKSGALRLRRNEFTGPAGVVWFRDGLIAGASPDSSRASLLRRIVGAGAVDDTALHAAVARAKPGVVGVTRALIDAGAIDQEFVRETAADQVVDGIFELLRWTEGEFALDCEAVDVDDVGIALEPALVLAQARARFDSSDQIDSLVPGGHTVLVLPVTLASDPEVTRDEWALLSLVDGRRNVRQIAELTGRGEFAVSSTLASLVHRGLLVVKDGALPDHVSELERRLALVADYEGARDPLLDKSHRDGSISSDRLVRSSPEGPGANGMTAAAALTAARAAQRLASAQSSPRNARDGGPATRGAAMASSPGTGRSSGTATVPERAGIAASAHSPSLVAPERDATPAATTSTRTSVDYEPSSTGMGGLRAGGAEATSTATARPLAAPSERVDGAIGRDPSVNRSLLLRLIAGVRGL
ncbi:unannotated protein [freshwater metagenome]|uniref:Unannotated protein n=1 Tax=freshwater metagenome TaxID=449393 RepID=A0A6J7R7R8_9ZZZZ|nr:DUF4388 domain-containing protein [Actinomycetota bacterium]MSW36534.1 DUF4388 domain-containing protein [Actinomycetota bacterium]